MKQFFLTTILLWTPQTQSSYVLLPNFEIYTAALIFAAHTLYLIVNKMKHFVLYIVNLLHSIYFSSFLFYFRFVASRSISIKM